MMHPKEQLGNETLGELLEEGMEGKTTGIDGNPEGGLNNEISGPGDDDDADDDALGAGNLLEEMEENIAEEGDDASLLCGD